MRTIVERAVPLALARAVVSDLDAHGWTRYALIDRGHYSHNDGPMAAPLSGSGSDALDALLAAMTKLASDQLGFAVRPTWWRALRLEAGDYLLSHHDARHDEPLLECIADLSVAPSAFAVHYREAGRPHFVVPNQPLAISLVARTAASAANHTYVSKLHQGSAIVRIVARFVT